MTARFEVRHRELQVAWLRPGNTAAERSMRDRAEERLPVFDQRTGPLVDALAAAVRELRDAPRDGTVDIAALHRRQEAALAALDEEAER